MAPKSTKSASKTPRTPKPRAVQEDLPTMERPRIKRLEVLGEQLDQTRTELKSYQDAAKQTEDQILDELHKHEIIVYHTANGLILKIKGKESIGISRDREAVAE